MRLWCGSDRGRCRRRNSHRGINPGPGLKLSAAVQLLAVDGGDAAQANTTAIIPQFAAEGAALGAGVRAVAGIAALSSHQMQTKLGGVD